MNQTVYSTSTAQANMRRTGCAGMLRVAGASPSAECGETSIDGTLTCVQPTGHDGDHMAADA